MNDQDQVIAEAGKALVKTKAMHKLASQFVIVPRIEYERLCEAVKKFKKAGAKKS